MTREPTILLDLTRSVRRLSIARASGIDRVERAYLDWVLQRDSRFLIEIAGTHYLLGRDGGRALRALIDAGSHPFDRTARLRPDRDRRVRMGESLVRDMAIASGRPDALIADAQVYLNVGHTNLNSGTMAALAPVLRVVMLHDLIPLEYPEFARANGPKLMRDRLVAAAGADHLLTNSEDTRGRVRRVASGLNLSIPDLSVLPLGIDVPVCPERPRGDHFVCLGTIEPRKNHALLLEIWREDWPDLHIIGRRGWENREVFRRLDAEPPNIREEAGLGDDELWERLSTARALLFPSHVEGYGLPLAEALTLGTPVIASDLPALREVGGDVPDYLYPEDGPGWTRLIEEYVKDGLAPAAQITRMANWRPPAWENHFAKLETLLEDLLPQRAE
ncbi:MAG: glycosyltransferase family 1 protein [Pseudomonadota bacterium]